MGNVKMDSADVAALVDLSREFRSLFGKDFSFSLGYNSGFYDSRNRGDKALVANASEFRWFNHFPRHQHILDQSLRTDQIARLFAIGREFERVHGLSAYATSYAVPPGHQGLWPPYEPLYDAFERFNIRFSSTPDLDRPAAYGHVKLLPRHDVGLPSSAYSFAQVKRQRVAALATTAYDVVIQSPAVVVYTHQANYAVDRPAVALLRDVRDLLLAQEDYHIVFLPAEEVVEIGYEMQWSREALVYKRSPR